MRILSAQGWLAQRSKATRARLGTIAKLRNFAKDERVYLAGDPPNGVFGLVGGSINLSYPRGDGENYTVHRAGSGFWFGDLALFSDRPRLVSVHAAEPTVTVHLSVRISRAWCARTPGSMPIFYSLTYENYARRLDHQEFRPPRHRRGRLWNDPDHDLKAPSCAPAPLSVRRRADPDLYDRRAHQPAYRHREILKEFEARNTFEGEIFDAGVTFKF